MKNEPVEDINELLDIPAKARATAILTAPSTGTLKL